MAAEDRFPERTHCTKTAVSLHIHLSKEQCFCIYPGCACINVQYYSSAVPHSCLLWFHRGHSFNEGPISPFTHMQGHTSAMHLYYNTDTHTQKGKRKERKSRNMTNACICTCEDPYLTWSTAFLSPITTKYVLNN